MLFNSIEYIYIFLPIVFAVYFFLNKFKLQNLSLIFLLFASLYFYSTYKIQYTYIIILSIIFNYLVGITFKFENEKLKKFFLFFGIVGNILLLCGFKYFNHVIEILKTSFNFPINTLEILVPLGISFFTIQQISYLIDSYKNKIKQQNIIHYSLFICFFPQFLAGPIVRHQEIIPQFLNPKNHTINQENVFKGLFLITIGMLKKVLVADNLVDFINCVNNHQMFDAGLLSWGYAFAKVAQGYFDFSGYCDIALGSALLFNIILPNNFNSPFKARNIVSFWNRWHMTLIRFLKDYILKPLGGVSSDKIKTLRNLALVGLAYGCWLGCNLSFLIYGLLNAFAIYFYILWRNFRRKKTKLCRKISNVFAVFSTFILILLTTPFVSQPKLADSFSLFKSMLFLNGFGEVVFKLKSFVIVFKSKAVIFDEVVETNPLSFNVFFLLFCIFLMFISKNSMQLAQKYVKANNVLYTIILAVIMTICTLSITKYQEFVYFNF